MLWFVVAVTAVLFAISTPITNASSLAFDAEYESR
jgi:hypothetical protein